MKIKTGHLNTLWLSTANLLNIINHIILAYLTEPKADDLNAFGYEQSDLKIFLASLAKSNTPAEVEKQLNNPYISYLTPLPSRPCIVELNRAYTQYFLALKKNTDLENSDLMKIGTMLFIKPLAELIFEKRNELHQITLDTLDDFFTQCDSEFKQKWLTQIKTYKKEKNVTTISSAFMKVPFKPTLTPCNESDSDESVEDIIIPVTHKFRPNPSVKVLVDSVTPNDADMPSETPETIVGTMSAFSSPVLSTPCLFKSALFIPNTFDNTLNSDEENAEALFYDVASREISPKTLGEEVPSNKIS